jgi:uncharacterized protein (DUF885 family)
MHLRYASVRRRRDKFLIEWRAVSAGVLIGVMVALGQVHGRDSASAGDANFRAMLQSFLESQLERFPEIATVWGDHRFDDRINDLSPAGISDAIKDEKGWKAKFTAIDPTSLSAANAIDREWIIAICDRGLLYMEQLETYKTSPGTYMPTAAIYQLVERDYAPAVTRMRAVTAREKAWLRNFVLARQNLQPERTYKGFIPFNGLRAAQVFFRTQLPPMFAGVPDGPDKQAFTAANDALLDGLAGYEAWLRNDFAPHAKGQFAIGADAFRRMLADTDMVTNSLDQLENLGMDQLAHLQAQSREVSKKNAALGPKSHLEWLSVDTAFGQVKRLLPQLRSFVLTNHIVTIPSDTMPMVAETPDFMSTELFAGLDSPGPLEHQQTSFFYMTFPPWSATDIEREHYLSVPSMSIVLIHDVFPGHFVQMMYYRAHPDLWALSSSPATIEGWAMYCEQMMLDEGFHADDPQYRRAQIGWAILRTCRLIASIRMHTRGMTLDEATKFFEDNIHDYDSPWRAQSEAFRCSFDLRCGSYILGKLMVEKLRDDLRKKEGASFSLERFHEEFLKQGGIPVPLIRELMLGDRRNAL